MRKSGINKKIYIYLIAFLLIMALSYAYKLLFKGDVSGIVYYEEEETTSLAISESITEIQSDITISVYLCGEVNCPGVYAVEPGTLLNDVIDIAGGFTPYAASEYINLVYAIYENSSLYIPSTEEVDSITNSPILFRYTTDVRTDVVTEESDNGLININIATKEILMTLPGIGDITADAIISYRSEHNFESIEEIMQVSGIGESKFDRIRNLITI